VCIIARIDWRERITTDKNIHHREPCIRGTRAPVAILVGSIADGLTVDEILKEYPQIKRESIEAALAYVADVVCREIILPLAS